MRLRNNARFVALAGDGPSKRTRGPQAMATCAAGHNFARDMVVTVRLTFSDRYRPLLWISQARHGRRRKRPALPR